MVKSSVNALVLRMICDFVFIILRPQPNIRIFPVKIGNPAYFSPKSKPAKKQLFQLHASYENKIIPCNFRNHELGRLGQEPPHF